METAGQTTLADADKFRIIAGVLVAMFMAALDQTIVAPVIPTLGAALGGTDYISWIISAYFLTATATTPLYGKIADIHGRRPTLMVAIAIFVLGSVMCALAHSMGAMIAGRAIQGLGGGGLMALTQTVIGDLLPPRERGRISGYIAIMWGTASIAGPILGGVIAEHFSWPLIFWLNLPLAAIAVAMTNDTLRRLPWARRDHALDIVGSALVVVATVLLMVALALAPQPKYGWSSPIVIGLAAAALALVPVILRHMRRAPEPLIPMDVLSNRVVLLSTSSVFCGMAANMGLTVFIPLFLELALGQSSSHAGFALVGFMMGTVITANIAGRVMLRGGRYKRLPLIGLAVAFVALMFIAARVQVLGFYQFEALLFVIGAGGGFQFPVTTVAVQNAVDARDIGVATGVLAFMRALGSSLGVAVVGAVGAAAGVAIAAGERITTAGGNIELIPAEHFAPVFFASALTIGLSFVLLWQMPELPLRGRGEAR
jgi:EmrB/QacA subfamily drug resistance transporter